MLVEVKQNLIDIKALPQAYGKYELLERIGVGGMAEVYRARLPGVGGFAKEIVIKRLRPKHAKDQALVQLFIEEAKLAAHVTHKNVVQVYELGHLDSGELFIAMEYVRGTDLRHLTEHAAQAALRVPVWLALHIILEILEALGYAHDCTDSGGRPRNLVHCDVTPENIFISRSGDVKLGDFGVANDDTRINVPLADQTKGKLPYMSPEQVLEQPIDSRTDIFSASVVLWETITGRRLFPGQTPSEVMAQICASPRSPLSKYTADIPPALDQIVLRALAPDIQQRFQSAQELSGALKEQLTKLQPRMTTENVRRALIAIMDAPVVRPNASTLDIDDDDDGYDELRALDLRHESHYNQHQSALRQTVQPSISRNQTAVTKTTRVVPTTRTDRRTLFDRQSSFGEPITDFTNPTISEVYDGEEEHTYQIIRPRNFLDSIAPTIPPESIGPSINDTHVSQRPEWAGAHSYLREATQRTPETDAALQAYIADDEDYTLVNTLGGEALPSALGDSTVLLWARSTDEQIIGPMPPSELLDLLYRTEKRPYPIFHISTDLNRWLNPYELALLLGERLMDRDVPSSHQLQRGSLAKHSFVEVAGSLARSKWSGVLSVWCDVGHDRERVEIHLSQGAITHVRWTGAPFETWRTLFDDHDMCVMGVPEAFSQGIASGTQVMDYLSPESLQRVVQNRRNHARRQLQSAIVWGQGGFCYNRRADILHSEQPQSLLKILPSLINRSLTPEEIQRRLKSRLYHRHRFSSAFRDVLPDLGLTEEDGKNLSYLGSGLALGEAGMQLQGSTDGTFVWVMAYLLTEIGLLSME